MKRLRIVLGVVGIILLAAASYYYVQVAPRIRAGRQEGRFPDPALRVSVSGFRFETQQGIREIGDFSGSVVVVDVWASWCPPCVEGIPHLVALAEKYQAASFEIVGLSVDSGGWEDIRPFLEKHPEINYTVAVPNPRPDFQLETLVDLDPLGEVAVLPTFFVIDPQGRLAGKFVGADGLPEVSSLVERLLQENSNGAAEMGGSPMDGEEFTDPHRGL